MNADGKPDPAGQIERGLRERLPSVFRASEVGACVSGVAHDVNNYLGAILAYAELMQQNAGLPDEAKRMMGNIISSVHKSSGLISTLTSVARKQRDERSMISTPEFLEQVLDIKRYDFRVARIDLKLDCPQQLPSLVVDRPKVIMALLYLLQNALEAGQENQDAEGETPAVTVTAEKTADSVEIAIKNTGPVIPADIRERMFDLFYTTKPEPHLGLGLALAREIAGFHNGRLNYDDQRGFVMSLPLATNLTNHT